MFFYQQFDFIQLMRREAVIPRERHWADPEFCFVAAPGHMDMRGLVSFVAIELKAITAPRYLNRWHGIKDGLRIVISKQLFRLV
jgi:hypothetical protein